MVVGHTVTPTRRVASRFDGRVILLDTGMLAEAYQGRPAALVIEGGRIGASYADQPGELSPPEALPRAVGPRPGGLDDDALEAWLATPRSSPSRTWPPASPSRSASRCARTASRCAPCQAALDDFGGVRRSLNEGDRFEYEVAAYELDRLLGLGMVPVTVPREVDGRKNAVQFWVEDAINARQMIEEKPDPRAGAPSSRSTT